MLLGCQHQHYQADSPQPLLITRHDQVEAAVGKLVTIRGEVTNSKIPTMLGVDVESFDPDLRGQPAQATGVLETWTVTREQLEATQLPFANRGPGTFYRLVTPGTHEEAHVEPLAK
jgi:hypothetical protein